VYYLHASLKISFLTKTKTGEEMISTIIVSGIIGMLLCAILGYLAGYQAAKNKYRRN
jgi:hypothetical protein